MQWVSRNHKSIVAATLVFLTMGGQVFAQDARLTPLFETLGKVSAEDAKSIERKIMLEWSKSGSAAMDLLLDRGQKAMVADKVDVAIGHFTALTDHAPEFAEGWSNLAEAYFKAEKLGPAMSALERALALEPRHFVSMFGLMTILEDAGHSNKALEVGQMIRTIHPHFEGLSDRISRLESALEGLKL